MGQTTSNYPGEAQKLGYCEDVSIPAWSDQVHQVVMERNRAALAKFAENEGMILIDGTIHHLPICTKMSDGKTVQGMWWPSRGAARSDSWFSLLRREAGAFEDIARSLREGVGTRPYRAPAFPVAFRVGSTVMARKPFIPDVGIARIVTALDESTR